MGVTYKGNTAFAEIGLPSISRRAGDIHELAQKWSGAATLAAAFEQSLTLYAPHPTRPLMWLDGYTSDGGPVFTTFTLRYIGLLSGEAPPEPTVTNSGKLISQPVTVKEGRYQLTVLVPSTTYTYYSFVRPGDTPRFTAPQRLRPVVLAPPIYAGRTTFNIDDYTAEDGGGGGGSVIYMRRLRPFLECFVAVPSLYEDEELVPGRLWRVKETIEFTLAVELDGKGNGGGRIQVSSSGAILVGN
jgi:hypothetical protein